MLRVIRESLNQFVSSLTADHYFWCSGGVSCCFKGVPGYYGMFQRCSGLFRGVPGGVPGMFRGVPGVFRSVPGCSGGSGCSGFSRHPQVRKPTTQTVPVAGFLSNFFAHCFTALHSVIQLSVLFNYSCFISFFNPFSPPDS